MTVDLQPLLVPVATTLLAGAGALIKDWRADRNRRNLRDQALADANAEVAFASQWWQAHQLLGTDVPPAAKERYLSYLNDADAIVTATTQLARTPRRHVSMAQVFLLEPMHRLSARICKWLFFFSFAYMILAAIVLASDSTTPSFQDSISDDVALLLVSAVLALIFRAMALGLEHHRGDTHDFTVTSAPEHPAVAANSSTAAPSPVPAPTTNSQPATTI